MMKKYLFSAFTLLSLSFYTQEPVEEHYFYPEGQYPYQGGEAAFYKDFHDIAMANQFTPCDNKEEIYPLKVIIPESGPIQYLKDETNKEEAEKFKCTFDLGLKVVSQMNKWKPVIIDGAKKQSIARFYIIPKDLFENYKDGYIPTGVTANYSLHASGGVNSFRKRVADNIDTRGYNWTRSFTMIVSFVVNTYGETEEYKIVQSSGLPEFDQRVLRGIKSVSNKKSKWTPAKINGIPVKMRFKLPLRFGSPE